MIKMDSGEFREKLADITNKVAYAHERVIIQRKGKPVAALISVDDLHLLEQLEDARDTADLRKAMTDVASGKETLLPWSEVRERLLKK